MHPPKQRTKFKEDCNTCAMTSKINNWEKKPSLQNHLSNLQENMHRWNQTHSQHAHPRTYIWSTLLCSSWTFLSWTLQPQYQRLYYFEICHSDLQYQNKRRKMESLYIDKFIDKLINGCVSNILKVFFHFCIFYCVCNTVYVSFPFVFLILSHLNTANS